MLYLVYPGIGRNWVKYQVGFKDVFSVPLTMECSLFIILRDSLKVDRQDVNLPKGFLDKIK